MIKIAKQINLSQMNKLFLCLSLMLMVSIISAQDKSTEGVKLACMNYIEGFYEGDASKLEASLQPTLHKFGFWKNKDSGAYEKTNYMTFDQALEYAEGVKKDKRFAKSNAPKNVEILNIGNNIAAAKVTAFWGIDYILLSKEGEKWMIEQVLWEGPLDK